MKIKDVLKLKTNEEFETQGNVVFAKEAAKGFKGSMEQFLLVKDDSCGEDDKLAIAVNVDDTNSFQKDDFIAIKGKVKTKKNGQLRYEGIVDHDIPPKKVEEAMKAVNGNDNGNGSKNGSKDNYWENKFEWDKKTWKVNRQGMSRSNGIQFAKDYMKVLLENKIVKFAGVEEANLAFWGYVTEFSRYIFDGTKPDEVIELEPIEEVNEEKISEEEGNADFDFGKNKKKVASKG